MKATGGGALKEKMQCSFIPEFRENNLHLQICKNISFCASFLTAWTNYLQQKLNLKSLIYYKKKKYFLKEIYKMFHIFKKKCICNKFLMKQTKIVWQLTNAEDRLDQKRINTRLKIQKSLRSRHFGMVERDKRSWFEKCMMRKLFKRKDRKETTGRKKKIMEKN